MCTQFLACHSETHWLAAFLFFQTTENSSSPNGWAQCLAQSLAQIRLSQHWVKAHRTTPWTWMNFPCLENTVSTPYDGTAQCCCFSHGSTLQPCWQAQCKTNTSFTSLLKASVKIFNVPKGPSVKGLLTKLWYYWEMMEPHQEVGLIGGIRWLEVCTWG